MTKKLAKTAIFIVLCNLAGCEATRLPDFEAPTLNISRHDYNKQNFVASKTLVQKLNLTNPTSFLPTYKPNGALTTPLIIMLNEEQKNTSFAFDANSNNKIYGFQKFQTDSNGNLIGVLMSDKSSNSTDFYTLTNKKLLKILKPETYKKGDLANVGSISKISPQAFVSKGADAKFVLRDPVTTGWNYQTFGYFKQDLNADGKDELGFQSLGATTPLADIPKQGLAKYLGAINGFFYDQKVGKKYMLYANIEIWISFDRNQALFDSNSSINRAQIKVYELSETGDLIEVFTQLNKKAISFTEYECSYEPFDLSQFFLFSTDKQVASLDRTNGVITYKHLQNLDKLTIADAQCKGQDLLNKHLKNGKLKANLYGEKAAEIGGIFELHDETQGIVYMGAFGAKRD